jgi:hypothetical protein
MSFPYPNQRVLKGSLRVNPTTEEQRGTGVPKIVEAYFRQTGLLE